MTNTLNQRVLEVVDYNSQWQRDFDVEQILLKKAMGENAIAVEHIGSTSVIGLAAKPIIDILIEVKSLQALALNIPPLVALGYIDKGENGIEGRHYLQKGEVVRTHHIHIFQSGDANLKRHRAFCAYLSAHPDVAKAYGELKIISANIAKGHIGQYMALKHHFIAKYEQIALDWF